MNNRPLEEIMDLSTIEGRSAALNMVKARTQGKGGFANLTTKATATPGAAVITKSTGAIALEAVAEAVEAVEDPAPVVEEKAAPTPPVATAVDLNALIQNAIAPLVEQLKAVSAEAIEARESNVKLEAQLSEAQQQVAKAAKTQTILDDLGKLSGTSMAKANFNTIVAGNSDKEVGALKDWRSLHDSASKVQKFTKSGRPFVTYDTREVREFVRENKGQLIRDLESHMKANGFLRGNSSAMPVLKDATSIGDIVGGFLPILSSLMRENNRPGFIFWQFPTVRIEHDKGVGNTIQIPRAAFQPGPTLPSDRLLSGGGVFYPIDKGSQSLSTGATTSEIMEWGLGRDALSQPVGINNFVASYSAIELLSLLERNLLHDYNQWEDISIRALWSPTSRVVYNDNSNITTDTASLVATDNGTMTYNFLYSLADYMAELQIPTFQNGMYAIAMPTRGITQLRQSVDSKIRLISDEDKEQVLNLFNLHSNGFVGKIQGLVAVIGNMMVFSTNAYGVGSSGAGIQTQTIASASRITRSSYAFGANTIGRGIGSEMEIRFDDDTDFGRMRRAIWHEECAFTALDVDPTGYSDTSAVPQQLRVIEVRTTDSPF